MNTQIGIWHTRPEGPQRLTEAKVEWEKHLEDWIEKDPSLIRSGLRIVGRQMWTQGGPLDLLGIGLQGEWVIVEIKRGAVRRDTIAQALDYASCIRSMADGKLHDLVADYLKTHGHSLEQLRSERPEAFDPALKHRPVHIIVVGTGRDDGLDRIVDLLGHAQLPISVVAFQVFNLPGGEQVLVRELTESDEPPQREEYSPKENEAVLRRSATSIGFGPEFASLLEAADQLGLHKYTTHKSVMFAPMADRRRCLLLVYADKLYKRSGLRTYVAVTAFEEFFGTPAQRVIELLGHNEWGCLTKVRIPSFIQGLKTVLQKSNTQPPPHN